MKEIKIIDLLNKIANGEEAPEKIKYDNTIYKYDEQYDYQNKLQINYYSIDKGGDFFNNVYCYSLNDEVEIIEDEKQETKPITKKDFETLGYACGEIQKAFTNGWTKSLENKPLKEEKEIPEKLDIREEKNIKNNWKYVLYVKEHKYNISTPQKIMGDKINEIIDIVNNME